MWYHLVKASSVVFQAFQNNTRGKQEVLGRPFHLTRIMAQGEVGGARQIIHLMRIMAPVGSARQIILPNENYGNAFL